MSAAENLAPKFGVQKAHCRPNLTFTMIKSDAFQNGVAEKIKKALATRGYVPIHSVRWDKLPIDRIEAFYAEHLDRPYFPDLRRSVEGTVLAMLLEKPVVPFGVDPIAEFRAFIGKTNAREADPESIRARFGGHRFDPDAPLAFNAIHGSDSPAAVVREARIMLGYEDDAIVDTITCGAYRLSDYSAD